MHIYNIRVYTIRVYLVHDTNRGKTSPMIQMNDDVAYQVYKNIVALLLLSPSQP